MTIKELVNKYTDSGNGLNDSRNLAAQEIIIRKISASRLSEHVTLKGGIIMYNLTKNDRRVTQDLDFDLISYSIDEESINLFIKQLNKDNDGFDISIVGKIDELHQDDYRGVRVNIAIKDVENDKLRLKLDIGVHTYKAIPQNKMLFCFDSNSSGVSLNANPLEQVFAEKLLSLAKIGAVSTRYKDIYDFYYLIKQGVISLLYIQETLLLFLNKRTKPPITISDFKKRIFRALNNQSFANRVIQSKSRWLEVDYDELKTTILDFVALL